MDEISEGDILQRAQEMDLDSRNAVRRETETPMTQVLSPEAREDAQKVAKEVVAETDKLLERKDEVIRADPEHIKGNLMIAGKNAVDRTIFQGASLGISRYTFDYHPDTQSRNTTQELWHFYPDHVMKTIRHSSETYAGVRLAPKGLATEKIEANKDELQVLLNDIKTSVPYTPNL